MHRLSDFIHPVMDNFDFFFFLTKQTDDFWFRMNTCKLCFICSSSKQTTYPLVQPITECGLQK